MPENPWHIKRMSDLYSLALFLFVTFVTMHFKKSNKTSFDSWIELKGSTSTHRHNRLFFIIKDINKHIIN